MTPAARRSPRSDPTHYPVFDDMGEGVLHMWILELLRPLLERYLAGQGKKAFVGADQFIYWVQHEPTTSVSPDIYVLPGVAPDTEFGCWKVWETGVTPSFALEVVSRERAKDYRHAPLRYDALGVRELIMFDPEWDQHRDALRWQVYRRLPRGFVQTTATNEDRVRSKVLGAWLRVIGEGPGQRVRLALGRDGNELYPTHEERTRALEAEIERLREELERRD